MGNFLTCASCIPGQCLPSPSFFVETVSERTGNASALSDVLKRRATVPKKRVIGGNAHTSFLEQENSPMLCTILEGIPRCMPGKTYIIVSKSQNGKSSAAKDVVLNHLGSMRNGLYINAGGTLDIIPSLEAVLNTAVNSIGIVSALVTALGISQAGKNKAASLLFLDEVNSASSKDGEGRSNAGFVQDLLLRLLRVRVASSLAY
jgi:hypothetical protein